MADVHDYRTIQAIDGVRVIPLLAQTGNPSEGRILDWNCPNIWNSSGPGIGPTCTVRNGDWKLIYFYDSGKKELYNIAADISEKTDLTAQHPEIVKRLSKDLGEHLRNVDGQRTVFKATGQPCPWPDEVN